jgi:hypothetical protein
MSKNERKDNNPKTVVLDCKFCVQLLALSCTISFMQVFVSSYRRFSSATIHIGFLNGLNQE